MPLKPKIIAIKRIVFDAAAIAKALHVPEAVAIAKFKDGRVAGQWGEVWAASLYEFVIHGHANVPATDGAVSASQLGDLGVSVKSLTARGVKFQQSIYQGGGRTCTQDDVISSIENSDRHLVVDITNFPTVDFIVLPATWLLKYAHTGKLTRTGWRRTVLYEHLKIDGFDVQIEELNLAA